MAWQDRAYSGEGGSFDRGGAPGIRGGPGGILIWLVMINVLVFITNEILTGSSRGNILSPERWGAFSLVKSWQAWRFVTYQFLHGGFFHLLNNLIFLWIFGQYMEKWWGSKRFLAYYLICGIGGAIVFGLVSLVPAVAHTAPFVPLVGASGSVFGLMVGCWMKFPKAEIRFFLMPFGFTIQLLCGLFVFFNVLQVVAGSYGAGSATAHLGGALFGFALMKWSRLLNFADRLNPQAIQEGVNQGRYERKQKKQQAGREEIDRILTKVSEHGLQSLTKKEQKLLKQDTDRLRGQ